MSIRGFCNFVASGLVLCGVMGPATVWGAIIITSQTTAGNTNPTTAAVGTDLLQTNLLSVSPVPGSDNSLVFSTKYNGTTGTAHENSGANPANINSAGTYDFNLNTAVNTLGYDITAVNTYTGWTDFRAGQDNTIWYSLVGSATFTQFADINIAHSNGTLRTSVTDNTGLIASGVDAIRFIVDQSTFVYREVDLIGTPTQAAVVPEPASVAIWSFLGLGIACLARRRLVRK